VDRRASGGGGRPDSQTDRLRALCPLPARMRQLDAIAPSRFEASDDALTGNLRAYQARQVLKQLPTAPTAPHPHTPGPHCPGRPPLSDGARGVGASVSIAASARAKQRQQQTQAFAHAGRQAIGCEAAGNCVCTIAHKAARIAPDRAGGPGCCPNYPLSCKAAPNTIPLSCPSQATKSEVQSRQPRSPNSPPPTSRRPSSSVIALHQPRVSARASSCQASRCHALALALARGTLPAAFLHARFISARCM
jgi:hypothetical protein